MSCPWSCPRLRCAGCLRGLAEHPHQGRGNFKGQEGCRSHRHSISARTSTPLRRPPTRRRRAGPLGEPQRCKHSTVPAAAAAGRRFWGSLGRGSDPLRLRRPPRRGGVRSESVAAAGATVRGRGKLSTLPAAVARQCAGTKDAQGGGILGIGGEGERCPPPRPVSAAKTLGGGRG
jgi:hypothetical protein